MPHRVTRREFISTAVATAAVAGASRMAASAPPKRPNVLFILADDLGYGDLSCYGRPDYQTPVLDAFAKQGIRFTDNYAAAPVCTMWPLGSSGNGGVISKGSHFGSMKRRI